MFANSHQSGFISIFFSVGSNPLALWDKQVKNGHIRRVIDDEVKSLVLDIGGTNVATTYITCPIKPRASLGVKLPYFVMIIKNMKKYFSFEIQILDDKDMRRRFRVSNFQSTTKVRPFCTTMPIGLSAGWNQVQFNLADFTKRAYGSAYMETVRVQIHANVRIRRIYFTDQLHSDEDLPNEFKLFAPGPRDQKVKGREKKASKDTTQGEPSVPPIKTDLKPDEEVPPPPSPAEESPVVKEEIPVTPEGDEGGEIEGEPVKEEVIPKAEPPEEGEVPPEGEEGTEPIKTEIKEESKEEPLEEGGQAPVEGEGGEGVPEESAEVRVKEEPTETEESAVKEEAPAESGEVPGEGGEVPAEVEPKVESEVAEDTAVPAEDEAPVEQFTEETTEASEMAAETTEAATTEVSETEGSPSEPATTDNEEEA